MNTLEDNNDEIYLAKIPSKTDIGINMLPTINLITEICGLL